MTEPIDTDNVVPLSRRKADRAAKAAASAAAGSPRPAKVEAERSAEPSQKERLAKIAAEAEFWRDADYKAFATLQVDGHRENGEVRSEWFKRHLVARYSEVAPIMSEGVAYPSSPSINALNECLLACEAVAARGPVHVPAVRVAGIAGTAVYLDLVAPDWSAVEVTADGWRIVAEPPVKFLRPNGLRPLPRPVGGAHIDEFAELLGFGRADDAEDDRSNFMLLCGWMVAALSPTGPYPVLLVGGEQGSGKSTVTSWLKRAVDPSAADRRSPIRDIQDLMLAGKHSHILNFDNFSRIDAELSDALARLSTGAAFSTRKMYSDDEETIISLARPVMGNGIPELATEADLADRVIGVKLKAREDAGRRDERTLNAAFTELHPRLLGTLLDGVASALANLEDTRHALEVAGIERPRMLDAALWIEAAAVGWGWPRWAFLHAYNGNRAEAAAIALEADTVATVLRRVVERSNSNPVQDGIAHRTRSPAGWEVTATELLRVLTDAASETERKARNWPKDATRLSSRLRRSAGGLRRAGVSVVQERGTDRSRTRKWVIRSEE